VYEGLCPFCDERTPSFGINPAEKLLHCFGCGEGGDAFRFVQLTEGVEFKGALGFLADRCGVQLEVVEEDPAAAERRRARDRLLELLERTAAWYVRVLWEAKEADPVPCRCPHLTARVGRRWARLGSNRRPLACQTARRSRARNAGRPDRS
jgi:DNA primase